MLRLSSLRPRSFRRTPNSALLSQNFKSAASQLFSRLFQEVGAVEGVALRGYVSGIGDDVAEFRFICAVAHAGGVNHIFFDQNAAHIVGAELDRKSTRLNSSH